MTGPGIYSYSTTPASNVQANTGINWDEGMPPASVNNSARQNMTDLRNAFNDLAWFKYGKGDLDYSPVYVAATQFKIAGADVSLVYHVGRRVRAVGSGTGTIYGTISTVAFSTDTTVTVVWDSGSLSNETLVVSLSQIPATSLPLPIVSGTFTPTDASGASLTFTNPVGYYRRVPGGILLTIQLTYPVTANGSNALIGALPFTSANLTNVAVYPIATLLGGGGAPTAIAAVVKNSTTLQFNTSGGAATNANMSGIGVDINGYYPI